VDRRLRLVSAAAVRSRIARLILAESLAPASVGAISLQPHQISAATRLRAALEQFHGALLCDDVGMGKTYVATAVAQQYARCLVVAPATLVSMWRDALTATRTVADIVTFAALSRADVNDLRRHAGRTPAHVPYDLVIVDEAHHARNPGTNRYFALISLARGARVLLLSATPIHNRRADLVALLSLFLGSRARSMTSAELGLCVVRREHAQLEGTLTIPVVLPATHHQLSDSTSVVDELMSLPPPLPVRDGGPGGVLIGRGLVHQWASSEAALGEAVSRRIARATALRASLEAGTYPTARELETWTYGEGVLQLGFPELLSAPVLGHAELLEAIRVHLNALQQFRARPSSAGALDTERAGIVADIRSSYPGAKIVAFAQYSETVSMLFRRLAFAGRVAMLTSHGARIAGGALTRREAIGRFAPVASHFPPPGPAEAIDLLLTTDLLSEGVNLQDAKVVVHLDIPWTLARMEQRVGRAARLGSPHAQVHVHILRPSRSAAVVLGNEAIVQRKWTIARSSVGTSAPNPLSDPISAENVVSIPSRLPPANASVDASLAESTPAKTERLRSILQNWLTRDDMDSDDMVVATVRSPGSGFVAAAFTDDRPQIFVGHGHEVSTDLDDQIAACLSASSDEIPTDTADCERAVRALHSWCTSESASAAAGVGSSSTVRRRQITSRIDLAIQSAPPHLRSSRSVIAARARRVVTTQQCAAVELELDSLLHSDLPADEWLDAVAGLESSGSKPRQSNHSTGSVRIQALLLMRAP
jgi:helicase-like protein/SNF2 domain-containing protein